MHVVATAGHVDHGKSALVRALTGTDPDRLAEERRRGLTIELGHAWTTLPGAGEVAFVDVPGHERFLTTTLAGVGPVPAVLLVVAADDPWMPQAAEHLAALDALGVRHGVVAVTRADLADPAPARQRALTALARTGLAGAPAVAVSSRTGAGLDVLRAALAAVLADLPVPDADADVRLWVDRRFTVAGAGTVVTGTLPAGTVRVGQTLTTGADVSLRVRALQSLGRAVEAVPGTARVALNLAGGPVPGRGGVLLTPGAFHHTTVVDVRLTAAAGTRERPPERPVLHVGAADLAVHHRPLGAGLARLTLDRALPLRVGDRAVLRDPGSRELWGVVVLDPAPPALARRGDAGRRAETLAAATGRPDATAEVRRRGLVERELLRRIGVPGEAGVPADGWLMSAERAAAAGSAARSVVAEHDRAHPLDPGMALPALAERLGLPSPEVARAVVGPPLVLAAGRVTLGAGLPAAVAEAVGRVREDLRVEPFAAPTADRLRELGLDDRALAAAARAGLLLRPAPGLVLLPDAAATAAGRLASLPQPFTAAQAREALGTTRRVALPLLEHLDRLGITRRLPDDRREVRSGTVTSWSPL
ncbi:SelB C-terminal domain-containing protein [Georgenia muralis]|uniref:Selenocysteine-specific elongation factor n=1 Tax=Georgenia muralis TaxID=154117 RepID=A0A3N4Z6U6_9MICO|nr:SelB C-terminal domain-containing protein [Georgenia muralis]RPF27536.1 selenocysteine-specific elongation factor [Georgenia muralis]